MSKHGYARDDHIKVRAPATTGNVDTCRMFSFEFINDVDYDTTVERILADQPNDGLLPLVVTPNVDDVLQLRQPENAVLADISHRARYVLPDGQPIVWTSRMAGRRLAARLPGSRLFGPLWERIEADSRRVVVLAPSQMVADRLAQQNPKAAIIVAPLFDPADHAVLAGVVNQIWSVVQRDETEFVILGIGFPKQQLIALGLLKKISRTPGHRPLILLLGGSLNMHTGVVPFAPEWVQNYGVEFLYRFLREPRRLFHRYFVRDTAFLPLMLREVHDIRKARIGGRE